MRWMIRGVLMMVLCLMLCAGAMADAVFIPELSAWDLENTPVQVEMSADVQAYMPYDDARTAQLNALLGHVSLQVHLQRMNGEQWSRMTLQVDQEDVLSALLRETASGTEAQFSVAPYVTYTWPADEALDMTSLLGGTDEGLWLDGSETQWMDDALVLFDAMTQAMPDYLSDNKYSVTIENMGKATRKQILTIPKSAVEGLGETLATLCPEGTLKTYLAGAVFSGKQVLTLWRDAEGQILRVDWEGNVGQSQSDLRQVSLVWRLSRSENEAKDDLTLKTPRVQGSGRNNLTLERALKVSGDSATLKMEITTNTLADGVKTVVTSSVDLKRTTQDGHSRVTGEIDMQRQIDDSTETEQILIQPDVLFEGTLEEPVLTGQLAISRYQAKRLQEQATLTLRAQQVDWMQWELRSGVIRVSEDEVQTVSQQLIKGMAVVLTRHLVLLPEEDVLFFSDGLAPEVWQQIVDAAQNALESAK